MSIGFINHGSVSALTEENEIKEYAGNGITHPFQWWLNLCSSRFDSKNKSKIWIVTSFIMKLNKSWRLSSKWVCTRTEMRINDFWLAILITSVRVGDRCEMGQKRNAKGVNCIHSLKWDIKYKLEWVEKGNLCNLTWSFLNKICFSFTKVLVLVRTTRVRS